MFVLITSLKMVNGIHSLNLLISRRGLAADIFQSRYFWRKHLYNYGMQIFLVHWVIDGASSELLMKESCLIMIR